MALIAVQCKHILATEDVGITTDICDVDDGDDGIAMTDIITEVNLISRDTTDIINSLHDTRTMGMIQDAVAVGPEQTSLESIRICRTMLRQICDRLSIESSSVMPSMEAFESRYERKQAYELTMEGIGESIKKIWDVILNALQTVWKHIKNFAYQLFGEVPKLRRKIAALKKACEQVGYTPRVGEYVDPRTSIAFSINGRMSVDNVITILDNHLTLSSDVGSLTVALTEIGDMMKLIRDTMRRNITELREVMRDQKSNIAADVMEISDEMADRVRGHELSALVESRIVTVLHMEQRRLSDPSISAISISPYLGGRKLVLYRYASPDDSQQFSNELEIEEMEQMDMNPDKPINTMLRAEMLAVLAKADRLLSVIDGNRRAMEQLNKFHSGVESIIMTMRDFTQVIPSQRGFEHLSGRYRDVIDQIRLPISSLISILNKAYTSVPMMNLRAANEAVRYVAESYKQYR